MTRDILFVSGMSGAGKSTALKMLEDMGYFCIDNLPIELIDKFVQLSEESKEGRIQRVAVGVDIRSGSRITELQDLLKELKASGTPCRLLYLDADDRTLVKRYKETRRNHPLAGNERIEAGITREREIIAFLKEEADYILDTSQLLTRELKAELEHIFVQNGDFKNLMVTILSFGFKYGIPADADLVFDVRFLPNPYYDPELRPQSGLDAPIRNFVMKYEAARVFSDKLEDMVRFLIPNYISEGKNQLVIAVGCTGGKHRSVTLAEELYARLKESEDFGIRIEHRDIPKDAMKQGV
ncbi:MAG: RNase adapter RapZ [Eubacteriales bacterium]|nr:RNase adapter RapZ [Eubacteriales bacterium]